MSEISIRNLKSITELDFQIPPPGVHVLTGINGSGKTTLLTCLERLAHSNAFQRHFKTTPQDQFDDFSKSKITYSHNGNSVSYSYGQKRWAPTPRENASILSTMGFSGAIFLTSTGERFYTQTDELNTRTIRSAPEFFRTSLNQIFQTNKYDDLRIVKLSGRGRGFGRNNYGFIMPVQAVAGQSRYYTEKNFSLGEILIINALFQLQNVAVNSLVLIDEIELALHPRVQVKFLDFLKHFSDEKQLTVIISSHSSSLIKAAPRLIYLERNPAGHVAVEYDCYPAIALQNVAIIEEVQPDFVIFVEDDYAKLLTEELLSYFFQRLYDGRRPIIKVLPVGGWENTIRLMQNCAGYLIPLNTQIVCFLDADVQPQINAIQAKAGRTESEQRQLALYHANHNNVRFLPITPEQGMVEFLNLNPNNHIQSMQNFFDGIFDIAQIIGDEANRVGIQYPTNPRAAAKMRLSYYIERIHFYTNRDINQVKHRMVQYYATDYCTHNHPTLQASFNPHFN